jgi:predicted ABC-type ATPase
MYVVAGPSGSGKTSAFPAYRFGCDYFNADDYAAQLNGGTYIGIPKSIRAIVGPICEKFIQDHIADRKDFATETTLRSLAVFDQMKQAHAAGFDVEFSYVCVEDISKSIDRVAGRADLGGHSASENTVRDIRAKSLPNLLRIFEELGTSIDLCDIYDNSTHASPPKLVASYQRRLVTFLATEIPSWLDQALAQSPWPTAVLRTCCLQNIPLPFANTGP